MNYYKIKVTSPIVREYKDFTLTEDEKEIFAKIGLDITPDPERDAQYSQMIYEYEQKHDIFLNYNDRKGFNLVRESLGNLFSEEAIKSDKLLREYLKDKEYELIEADPEDRIMRYHMKE